MKNFPRYDVVVWHRIKSSPPGLDTRIITQAGREPDEADQMQGIQDLHWTFHTPEAAITFAESLFEFAASDDVLLLSILAIHDDSFSRRIYKDSRSFAQGSS